MSEEENNIQEEVVETPETTEEVVEEQAPVEEVKEEPAETPKKKREKKRWKDMTPEEKKKKRIRDIIISAIVVGLVIVLVVVLIGAGIAGNKTNNKMIKNFEEVGSTYAPTIDADTGYYTFTIPTNKTFKILQLTDIHIGAGAFSIQKDNWALNAVAKMIQSVKPDLVVVTGDVAYPVPFQAGTFNNERAAVTFANLMEQLGVYYALAYGNHDTEAYALYSREEISERVYLNKDKYPHCLFQLGPEEVDGCGNYIVNVKNELGLITQSVVILDSHSYTDGDWLGMAWKYDNLHQNQVDWYEAQIKSLDATNKAKFAALSATQKVEYALACGLSVADLEAKFGVNGMSISSSMYFHIPLVEYKDAYELWNESGEDVGTNYEYLGGIAGESKKVVYCGMHEDEMFETIQKLKSTTHVFCGHDHLNNFAIKYYGKDGNKSTDFGVVLSYGYSIDYLAYAGIAKKYEQRGGTIISVAPSGTLSFEKERLIDVE